MKRYLFLCVFTVAAVLFAWGSVLAADVPEFDAVGCDSTNYFVDPVMREVISKNTDTDGRLINSYSSFEAEEFLQTAGMLYPDPCFTYNGTYYSALTEVGSNATYEWNIVLQMKPESDINLEIRACVLKQNSTNIWTGAWQTGRFRTDTGEVFYLNYANPIVNVQAFPGPYSAPGFFDAGPFHLEGRLDLSSEPVMLDGVFYSAKSLWPETILIALPKTGQVNIKDEHMFTLKQGDIIRVTIDIPPANTADVRYGKDSVILKYNGIVGTWYFGSNCAARLGPVIFKPIVEKAVRINPLPTD